MRQSDFVRWPLSACVMLTAGVLAGCSSIGDMLPSTGSMFGSSSTTTTTTTATAADGTKIEDIECPGVEVRAGASTLTIAASGKAAAAADAGALELRYQGNIVRTARECVVRGGVVSLKVGVEGRIIIGPAGGPGNVDVPIRFAVVKEGAAPKTITTKLHRITATLGPDQPRTSFTVVADDLGFPMPVPAADVDTYVIYVGFDPQAEKPKPAPRKPATKKPRRQG